MHQTNVLEYLEKTVTRVPDKLAFSNGEEGLTFAQVYHDSRAIGSYLASKGYYNEPVVVFMEKHPRSVAAFFGVVYSGCFYVPIDEEMPAYRVELIFKTLNPRAVLCDAKTRLTVEKMGYEGASMAHVSGLGHYESRFQLPDDWNASNGALLKMDNAGGGTVSVKVNGKEASMPDTRTLTVDISDLVRPGENAIEIVVASTLTNRMIQRNYPGYRNYTPDVRDYGLTGHVRILPYAVANIG